VVAGARGAARGCVEDPGIDDRRPRPRVRWDGACRENPLAKGCI
jgi:hypothetical protein